MRGVTNDVQFQGDCMIIFQPALPMRGVTYWATARTLGGIISTRTPHAGSDNFMQSMATET